MATNLRDLSVSLVTILDNYYTYSSPAKLRNDFSKLCLEVDTLVPSLQLPHLNDIDVILYADEKSPSEYKQELTVSTEKEELHRQNCLVTFANIYLRMYGKGIGIVLGSLEDNLFLRHVYYVPEPHFHPMLKKLTIDFASSFLNGYDHRGVCLALKILIVLLHKCGESIMTSIVRQRPNIAQNIFKLLDLPKGNHPRMRKMIKWIKMIVTDIHEKYIGVKLSKYLSYPWKQFIEIRNSFEMKNYDEAIEGLRNVCSDLVDLVKGQKHDKVLNVTINFLNTGIMRCLYDYFMSSRDFHKRLDLAERFFKRLLQSKVDEDRQLPRDVFKALVKLLLESLRRLFVITDINLCERNCLDLYLIDKTNEFTIEREPIFQSSAEDINHAGSKIRRTSAPKPLPFYFGATTFECDYLDSKHVFRDFTVQGHCFVDDIFRLLQLLSLIHNVNEHLENIVEMEPLLEEHFQSVYIMGRIRILAKANDRMSLTDLSVGRCPFLVSKECRKKAFESRQNVYNAFDEEILLNRSKAFTKIVSKCELIEDFTNPWVVTFKEEIGEGKGPVKELFSIFCKEMLDPKLKLWVHSSTDGGLFPSPIVDGDTLKIMSALGVMIAKSILDGVEFNIPISKEFAKFLITADEPKYFDENDLRKICPIPSKILDSLIHMATLKRDLNENDPQALNIAIESLTIDGCNIEDLGIDFTLPGYPDVEMTKGGKNMTLTAHNVDLYVDLLFDWYLTGAPTKKMCALMEGFTKVLPKHFVGMLGFDEFCSTLRGEDDKPWESGTIWKYCTTDQGYNMDSEPVKFLIEVMSSFDSKERSLFLEFVTALPRLPLGGFKDLDPRISICPFKVSNPDAYLPTSVTCSNILNLPEYSSVDILREKLLLAITEGRQSFRIV